MIATPMLFRFTASGPTPEAAFAAFAAQDGEKPHDPFWPRADLARVTQVTVAADRYRCAPTAASAAWTADRCARTTPTGSPTD